jgi:uncharacterized membrane protein YvbJ
MVICVHCGEVNIEEDIPICKNCGALMRSPEQYEGFNTEGR